MHRTGEQNRKRKIIFLDVDGAIYDASNHEAHNKRMDTGEVRNIKSHPSIVERNIPDAILPTFDIYDLSAVLGFSSKAILNVRRLCHDQEAEIVISSSWRDSNSFEQLMALFSICNLSEYIIGCTPSLGKRGEEIVAWLSQHEVDSFAVLDDVEYDIQTRLGKRFIHCHSLLSDNELYPQAYQILNTPLDYVNCQARRCWEAIEYNSPLITQVSFNLETITTFTLCLRVDYQSVIERLFLILTANDKVTDLAFKDFHYVIESTDIIALHETEYRLSAKHVGVEALEMLPYDKLRTALLSLVEGEANHYTNAKRVILTFSKVGSEASEMFKVEINGLIASIKNQVISSLN